MKPRKLAVPILVALALTIAATGQQSASPRTLKLQRVEFTGATQVPGGEQKAYAAELAQRSYPADSWQKELGERARDFWQQRGYFLAKTEVEAISSKNATSARIRVEEGRQYRLKELRWQGAKAFTETELNALMPLRAGDVFNTQNVRHGLDALRHAYVAKGYINMTPVPDTKMDADAGTVTLSIDIHEGAHPVIDDRARQ